MALKDFAYSLVFGKPLVLWIGLTAFTMFLSALAIIAINNYTKFRIPVYWHVRLALTGLAIAIIHVILALSIYF